MYAMKWYVHNHLVVMRNVRYEVVRILVVLVAVILLMNERVLPCKPIVHRPYSITIGYSKPFQIRWELPCERQKVAQSFTQIHTSTPRVEQHAQDGLRCASIGYDLQRK